jgi:hypothetical protein
MRRRQFQWKSRRLWIGCKIESPDAKSLCEFQAIEAKVDLP